MTNQTIDGVPREHLAAWAKRLESADSGFPGSVPFLKELRALLDAPVCGNCAGLERNVPCPDCKPAAQPQGGQAAVVHTLHSVAEAVDQSSTYTVLTSNQCHSLAQSLNAQQARRSKS